MTEKPSPPADRRVSSDTAAILLATLYAPFASLTINLIGREFVGELAALERTMAHPAMAEVISFFAAIWRDPKWMTLHACIIAWLGVVPVMMLLRANGWLRFRTALPAGAVLPLSTVSAITLLMWHSTSAATAEKFVVYGVLVLMTVPAAVAAAGAFWGVNTLASTPKLGVSAPTVSRETDRVE